MENNDHGDLSKQRLSLLKPLDKARAITKTRQFLPHWEQPGCTYFITWRMADSLPKPVLNKWRAELDLWLKFNPKPWDAITQREYAKRFEGERQKYLDAGYGACVLRDVTLRNIVAECLHHFDGQRYDLGDYIVMPNHVHVLVTPREEWKVLRIAHTWKSFSAHRILKQTGGRKPFWLQESFDHVVRSQRQLEHYRTYIRENPVKARLGPGSYTYWESSPGTRSSEESGAAGPAASAAGGG